MSVLPSGVNEGASESVTYEEDPRPAVVAMEFDLRQGGRQETTEGSLR